MKKKKENKNTYDISSIKRVTRRFLEVSRSNRAKKKKRQRNVQKKCAARAVSFLLISVRLLVFPSPLSIRRFSILSEQTINIIVSLAFSPCYIYIFVINTAYVQHDLSDIT